MSAPLLDPAAIERLKESAIGIDQDAFVREIIAMFLDAYGSSLAAIIVAARERDMRKLGLLAHQLKGLCLNVGASRLAHGCDQLNSTAAGDLDAWVAALRQDAQATVGALEAMLRGG